MPMTLTGRGLATPTNPLGQDDLIKLAHAYNARDDRGRARLDRIYRGTRVRRRGSVLADGGTPHTDGSQAGNGTNRAVLTRPIDRMLAFYPDPATGETPGTAERMAAYERAVLPLAAEACNKALQDSATDPADITQLVTVSCTGFAAPGLEVRLIDALGLSPSIGRTNLGFMGCHGAVNGLRVADALAAADPAGAVLLCCAELCTLHFQYGDDPQHAVANALFADGAAACVGRHAPDGDVHEDGVGDARPATRSFRSALVPGSADVMTWRIGDAGFSMTLSPEIPKLVERHLGRFVADWLGPLGLSSAGIGGWAIHPGGPKVIDAVESALSLPAGAGDASRSVLAEHGNMSSPTVLFIVDRLARANCPRPWVVLAFGPGLVIEAALID